MSQFEDKLKKAQYEKFKFNNNNVHFNSLLSSKHEESQKKWGQPQGLIEGEGGSTYCCQ